MANRAGPTSNFSIAAIVGRRLCRSLACSPGDRVAYIAPNTHAQLESFYAVPQIGAVLVPINYRLTADDFAYLINHSGARIVCAHSRLSRARSTAFASQLPSVEHFVALKGAGETAGSIMKH